MSSLTPTSTPTSSSRPAPRLTKAFFLLLKLSLFLLLLPYALASPISPTPPPDLLVTTTSGRVQGFLDNTTTPISLQKWLGVPFGEDTSGSNRWRPPKKKRPISAGVVNATKFGPACMQGRADGGNGTSVQSEDCLLVNIISPLRARNLPVYIYSYGGGFDSGSSSDPKIDGSFLASQGIVFVSYNYRLSLFGYPHSSEISSLGQTQNLGLLDTRLAVEWVRDNILKFGGNPREIVLGGESVGAEMTNQYLTAFADDPIIRGAIMQSADTSQPMWPIDSQLNKIAQNFSCPLLSTSAIGQTGQLDCLRKKSGVELQKVLLATGAQFQPVTDNVTVFGDFVKLTKAGRTAKVPLLIGTNKDEGTLIVEGEPTAYLPDITTYLQSNNLNFPWAFTDRSTLQRLYPVSNSSSPDPANNATVYASAYNATAAIWRDAHMLCLAHNLATTRTTSLSLPVWRYRFDLVASNLNSRGMRIGAFHGEDIRFVMGTWRTIVLSPPFVPATQQEISVSDMMVKAWTNFIKNPNAGPQMPGWKKFNPSDPSSIAILGSNPQAVEPGNHVEIDKTCVEYWNSVLPMYPQTFPECGSWSC